MRRTAAGGREGRRLLSENMVPVMLFAKNAMTGNSVLAPRFNLTRPDTCARSLLSVLLRKTLREQSSQMRESADQLYERKLNEKAASVSWQSSTTLRWNTNVPYLAQCE